MLALQLIALLLLMVSAVLFFGPQLVVYGPRVARDMLRNRQVQFVGGCWLSLALFVLVAPTASSALYSGGGAMSLVMLDIFTMQFQPV